MPTAVATDVFLDWRNGETGNVLGQQEEDEAHAVDDLADVRKEFGERHGPQIRGFERRLVVRHSVTTVEIPAGKYMIMMRYPEAMAIRPNEETGTSSLSEKGGKVETRDP